MFRMLGLSTVCTKRVLPYGINQDAIWFDYSMTVLQTTSNPAHGFGGVCSRIASSKRRRHCGCSCVRLQQNIGLERSSSI